MEENTAVLVAMIGAVATIIGAVLKGLWDALTGKHAREIQSEAHRRDSVARYKQEARESYDRAQREWERARVMRNHAHALEQYCIDKHGTRPEDLPVWPPTDP